MRDDSVRGREPIAVVGISALCPGDPTTDGFLSVMMEGRDQIRDVPPSRFSAEAFQATDPSERGDRTYCTRGAFIDPVPFDPMAFGIPPSVIAATDSAQLLTLLKAHELVVDAGVDRWGDAARERVGVILGAQGMTHLQGLMMSRTLWPAWVEELTASGIPEAEALAIARRINGRQPAWQEMTFPGFLGNITAGRVTNRLDFGGTNYVVDAACASSLAAVAAALNELYLGQSDVVVTGGCDLLTDAGTFLSFANSTALSRSGDCRPFSADADGTVIGEGIALLALRRLADAERDGDAIHAVIRGHGTASDGRGSAIYAPRSEGQVRAMERAYEAAGYDPATVGLIEAHGTGTGLGDATEVRSMGQVFGGEGRTRRAALGSVKSLIGHPKTSAGAVSLLKVVTALRHGVLPPTIKVGRPNEAFAAEDCPVHPNTVARPWVSGADRPRRAGLSAFGFGGTNAHVTVEEYRGPHRAARRLPLPAQLLLFSGSARSDVLARAAEAVDRARRGAAFDGLALASQRAFDPAAKARLGLVARDAEALHETLGKVGALLDRAGALPSGFDGAAYAEGAVDPGRIAFLFPGQGSQRVGMAGEIAMHFEAARAPWDAEDAVAREAGEVPLHEVVFPDPALSDAEAAVQGDRLRATEMAQPALALATLSTLALANGLGLEPDLCLGHSFGEVMALHAAGAFDAPTAVRIARERGRLMREAGAGVAGAMTSLALSADEVEALISRSGADVSIANRNAPRQVVVSGRIEEVKRLEAACPAGAFRRLPVSTAFHSPVVAHATPHFRGVLDELWCDPPTGTVLSNVEAAPYPAGIEACRETLASQIARSVLFEDGVRAACKAGARTFVEIGPGTVLSRLAAQCLEGTHAEVVSLGGAGVAGMLGGLARLAVRGVPLRLDALWTDRRVGSAEAPAPLKPHVVWVDSTMRRRTEAERIAGSEPRVFGADPGPVPSGGSGTRPTEPPGLREDDEPQRDPRARPEADETPPATGPTPADRPPVDVHNAAASVPPAQDPRAGPWDGRDASTPIGEEGASGNAAVDAAAMLATVSSVQERFLSMMATSHRGFLDIASAALDVDGRTVRSRPAEADPSHPSPISADPMSQDHAVDSLAAPRDWQDEAPAPLPEDEPVAPPSDGKRVETQSLAAVVTAVIAEKTGYPEDMLDPAMELEADLGVDSIRRVEILLALEAHAPGLTDPGAIDQERVAALRTIADVTAFLGELVHDAGAPGPARADAPPARVHARPPEAGAGPSSGTDANGPDPDPGSTRPERDGTTPDAADGTDDPAEVLLDVVAEATGYPVDMLEMEMELEADLGVDSIKRMEILMALAERLPGRLPPMAEADMATLGGLVTLADVTAHLRDANGRADASSSGSAPPEPDDATEPRPDAALTTPDFFVPALVAAPAGGARLFDAGELGTIRILSDDRGVSEALRERLAERGLTAEIEEGPPPAGACLVLLGALGEGPWDAASLGAVHRAAFEAIRAVGPRGRVLAVQDAAGPAGLDAMVLTLRKEWPDARAKAIRLDVALGRDAMAASIVEELVSGGMEPGVVLGDGRRRVPVLRTAASSPTRSNAPPIDERSVVVVSGGARGVAAACAEALARRHQPRLVLIGRTPLAPEPDHLAAMRDEAGLKAAIVAEARARGDEVAPLEIGRRTAAILAAREARGWLARIEAAGSEVLYAPADIRDASAVADALGEARERWGAVTGVIHAAGVIADRRIEDKSPESFAETLATKVEGFEALLDATRDDPLRLLVAFSSVAARFGSVGQIDYAAANAILGGMARREASRRGSDCLVRAIEWGPWDGGMVTPALARMMRSSGLTLIDPEAGAQAFCDLIEGPELGDVETVVTDAGNLPALGWPWLEALVVEAAE